MAKGMSIHIGLNFVDPDHYDGWDGELAACEFDAKDMLALARKAGFKTNTVLLTEQATAKAVIDAIADAGTRLRKNDVLLLTYSGHGSQVKDTNGDETDSERMDETWVLYDRELVDDELFTLWGKFKAGVRIIMLSDSCHSGTVSRAPRPPRGAKRRGRSRLMPPAVALRVERKHAKLYRNIQKKNRAAEKTKVNATVILISGCQDKQESLDGSRNGAFTGALKKVWRGGQFVGSYKKFRDRISVQLPVTQIPNYFVTGTANPKFEAQKPFTV